MAQQKPRQQKLETNPGNQADAQFFHQHESHDGKERGVHPRAGLVGRGQRFARSKGQADAHGSDGIFHRWLMEMALSTTLAETYAAVARSSVRRQ